MIRVFESEQQQKLKTLKVGDKIYFKAKGIATALGYTNTNKAVIDHVFPEYKFEAGNIQGYRKGCLEEHPQTLYVNEPGLYQLILKSHLPAARDFQKWVFETVLPSIRADTFLPKNNQICMKNEFDLHSRVVAFIRRFYPDIIITAGLGENQDTKPKRLKSWAKGYTRGQPDIIIQNLHKKYSGFCIEFKTPLGTGYTSAAQTTLLERYEESGYKCMISNDYDNIIVDIIEYARLIRIKCKYCQRKFISNMTLATHLKIFHRIYDQ